MIRGTAVSFALVVALTSATGADAHFAERQKSISGYVESATIVVRGTVQKADQKIEGGHATRDGLGLLRVQEVLKGKVDKARALRFESTGDHQPKFREGSHVLLFLEPVAGSDPPRFLTRQTAIEGVDLDRGDGPPLLSTVRGFLKIETITDPAIRATRLKDAILRQLDSPLELLWQDALFDLSKRTELVHDDRDVARIERVARNEKKASILRVGCVAKLSELAKAGRTSAIRALAEVLGAPGELIVRTMAAAALADTGSPLARRPLVGVLGDGSGPVRRAAADALGRLGETAAVDALGSLAATDPDAGVRFAALRALARIGDMRANLMLDRLARDPKFPDTPRAVDLARREVGRFDEEKVKR